MARMPEMLPEMRKLFLGLTGGDEQCETAWTHIVGCDRCQLMLYFWSIAAQAGECLQRGEAPPHELVEATKEILEVLMGSTEGAGALLRAVFEGGES